MDRYSKYKRNLKKKEVSGASLTNDKNVKELGYWLKSGVTI